MQRRAVPEELLMVLPRALTPMHDASPPIKNPCRRDDGDVTGDETAQVTAAELLHCG